MPTTTSPQPLEQRLEELAARVRSVEDRLGPEGTLERLLAAAAARATPRPLDPAPENPNPGTSTSFEPVTAPIPDVPSGAVPSATLRPRARARREIDLEQLLGGRVLAWVGAVSVLAGLVMLFALGISQGWIGPTARTIFGAGVSSALLAAGVWLHERRGRTEAARAAVAAGASGLFVAVTVATRVYDLVPAPAGLALAALVACGTAALAVRWRSEVVGAIGITGALLAPVLAGAPSDLGTLAFLLVATLAGAAVVVRQDWDWLMVAVVGLPACQWLAWLVDGPAAGQIVGVLTIFGATNAVAALGLGLRERRPQVAALPALLVACNAVVLAVAGFGALADPWTNQAPGVIWLAGLAAVHAAGGAAALRHGPLTRDLGVLALAIGLLLADAVVALAHVGSPVRTAVWALAAVGFAALARHLGRSTPGDREDVRADSAAPARSAPLRGNQQIAILGLGGQIALAAIQAAVALSADPGADNGATVIALVVAASGCMVSARFVNSEHAQASVALDIGGLTILAAATLVSFEGLALVAAWSVMALSCAEVARRLDDDLARRAAIAHLAAAGAAALLTIAPPSGLVEGLADLGPAIAGLALIAAGAARLGQIAHEREERVAWFGFTAIALLYGASLAVVGWVPASGQDPALGLSTDEMAQLDLSALWTAVGVASLLAGLRRDLREVRLGALALLAVVIAKVFLYDLATLTAVSRVLSFLGLGVLLLGAAFAYQRLRPEPPRDLRDVPPAMR